MEGQIGIVKGKPPPMDQIYYTVESVEIKDGYRVHSISQVDIFSSPDLSHGERDFPEISWLSIATRDQSSLSSRLAKLKQLR